MTDDRNDLTPNYFVQAAQIEACQRLFKEALRRYGANPVADGMRPDTHRAQVILLSMETLRVNGFSDAIIKAALTEIQPPTNGG
jgi:hypothetical protein